MSPSGVHINKTILIVIFGVAVGVALVYRFMRYSPNRTKNMSQTWKSSTEDFIDIPPAIINAAKQVTIQEKTKSVKMQDGKTLQIVFCEVGADKPPEKFDVLFLHGQAFTSKNWHEIGTLALVGAAHYRAVAVDLPGYGQSEKVSVEDKGSFLDALIKTLRLNNPVIVSPSMSGSFSLKYLFGDGHKTTGFVPVAPVGTSSYRDEYKNNQIPTMIVYGSKDKNLGLQSLNDLRALPNSKVFPIADAGHAAYMDDTDTFNKLLYNFLLALSKS